MAIEGTKRRAFVTALAAAIAFGVFGVTPVSAASYAQFTSLSSQGGDNAPSWSNDGQSVYYSTRVSGFPHIYTKAAGAPMNQSGTRLTSWDIEEFAASESGDGAWVVIAARDTLNNYMRLWRCPSAGGPPLTQMTFGPFDDFAPDWWGTGAT